MADKKSTKASGKAPDEGAAISAIAKALGKIGDSVARDRVLQWAISAFGSKGVELQVGGASGAGNGRKPSRLPVPAAEKLEDLLEQANPQTQDDRVLVICYWLQEHDYPEGFPAQAVNSELKQLGHPIKNITDKLDQLKEQNPALIRQVAKSGTARQARKTYKLTEPGKKRVRQLVSGEGSSVEKTE